MDRDQHIRHHASPQFTDALRHDPWLGDAGDASSFSDSTTSLEPTWMVKADLFTACRQNLLTYIPQIFDDFSPDATVQHHTAASQDHSQSQAYNYRHPNALGLDISMESSSYPSLPYSYDIYNNYGAHPPSPAHLRLPLPQIITSDLLTQHQGSAHATRMRSHSDASLTAASSHYPQSAGTSTPSTGGQSSLPVTPAPPTASYPLLAIPTPTSMYSPSLPYMASIHSNASSPTKSPLLHGHMPSPSMSPMAIHHTPAQYTVPVNRGAVESVLDIASRFPDATFLVPQRLYRPNTQSDRRRYVEEVDLEPPILFFMQHPEGCGISCKDAVNSRFSRLLGRDDSMFQNRGPSVSIRINVRALLFTRSQHRY